MYYKREASFDRRHILITFFFGETITLIADLDILHRTGT